MNIHKEDRRIPIGRKIEKVRRLRGMTQDDLGAKLGGLSKQSISRIEQSETLEDQKLEEICTALGVTSDGLKNYNEDTVLYNTANFYDGSQVTTSSINANISTMVNNPIEKIIELYESLLKSEKEKVELLQRLYTSEK